MPVNSDKPQIVHIYAERKIGKDGTITIVPIHSNDVEDMVPLSQARPFAGNLSIRQLQHLCDIGAFKTARKPGHGRNAQWRVSLKEIVERYRTPVAN